MGLELAIPAIASGIGLFQNHEASRRQKNQMNQANDFNSRAVALQEDEYHNFTSPTRKRLLELAQSFDPQAEARAGINQASATTEETITRALSRLRADYAKGGGTPGQSTEYGVRAQGTTNRAADPFRQYLAEAMSNPTLKRMQALQMALGGANPGQLSQTYFNAAQNSASMAGPGGDFTNVARMIADLFKQQKGGGGRGDMRGGGGSDAGTGGYTQVS